MITPLNMSRFKRWALQQLYYQLFEFIAKDFMGKEDCRLVHLPPNMTSSPTGGPIVHAAFQGGHSTTTDIKKALYKARAELGDLQVDIADETGEFTG